MLIDTHAHLYFDWFDQDRDQVIEQAWAAGVQKIINIGIDLETSARCIRMAEENAGLFAAVGLHPNDATQFDENTISSLRELTRHAKVVAIGEIGLDFYRDRAPVQTQELAFRQQIRLAKEVGLPIVIHNRQAMTQILEILKSEGPDGLVGGVFHCFSDSTEMAEQALELGFHISFTGNLTFKKSELPEVAKMIPQERLLLETDSPFLSPEPRRGRRNEPAHVGYIAAKLAEIKELTVGEVEQVTTENAIALFGLGEREM